MLPFRSYHSHSSHAVWLVLVFIVASTLGKVIPLDLESSLVHDNQNGSNTSPVKVHQNSSTSGIAYSASVANANMLAVGYPSGIINNGGTGANFQGTSTITQDVPSDTSTSVGGSLASNCQGGMTGTYIAGQQGIGLQASGNCDSIVIPT